MLKSPKVYIGQAGKKGRGVFARTRISRGVVLETSPYIRIPPKDDKKLTDTIINSYWFQLDAKTAVLGLGFVSLYNHEPIPNAEALIDRKKRTITIKTIRPIRPKEEVTINYGYELDL